MRRTRRAVAALRREESGLTLIELLVASMLGLVVVGGALAMFLGGVRSEPRTAAKVAAIQQARVTIDRITRELRQGLETPTATPSELAIVTYVKAASCGGPAASTAIPCRVTYACSAEICTRTVAQPDGVGPGPAVQVASGLASPQVFSYRTDELGECATSSTASPSFVCVELSLLDGGANPLVLGDGAALRNSEQEEAA